MPIKAVLLHIGEKDQANTRIIQQMRSIGSPTSLGDGKTNYRKDYIVHVGSAFSYRN
jgi:hypothetical protein